LSSFWGPPPVNALLIKAYPYLGTKVASKTDNDTIGTGTGFVLASSGLIVTNYHVVKDANRIEIIFPDKNLTKTSDIKIKDARNDIVILGFDRNDDDELIEKTIPYSIADSNKVRIGQGVFTLGFPLGDIMGSKPRVSSGIVNSLYGIQDDPRSFQISNPLQPGNSGGPLFTEKGELIGIVVSSLSAEYLYESTGALPQNVNFALKSDYLVNLISMLPHSDEILSRKNSVIQGPVEEQIEQLTPFIVQIRVY
jgi:S1-C subfamily serine protease